MTQKSAPSHRMNLNTLFCPPATPYISADMGSVCADNILHINMLVTDTKTKLINFTK